MCARAETNAEAVTDAGTIAGAGAGAGTAGAAGTDPTIDLVSPSVVSTSGGSIVTMFSSNLLAITASDVFVSLVSPRSPVPVAATVTSFDFVKNGVVFFAPSLPLEGPYSVVLN
jgi:hypothetical protein